MRRKNTTSEMMKYYIAQSLLLLMEQKALSDISIGEITRKAGVDRTTCYRHFTSKDGIIQHYYMSILSEYAAAQSGFDCPSLNLYLSGMFTHLKQYEKQLLLLHHNGRSHLILDALNKTFLSKQPCPSFDTAFATYYHTGGIYGTLLLWFSHAMRESADQMCKASLHILPPDFSPMLIR